MELDLHPNIVHRMTILVRSEIAARTPGCKFKGVVECNEVYVIAGHKGHPEKGRQKGRPPRHRALKGAPGRRTLKKEKPLFSEPLNELEMLPFLCSRTLKKTQLSRFCGLS